MSKRLLLIDGHSVAFRAFYALPVENFQTSSGAHTNAVFGFTSMLINLLRDEEPTHLAVAFDVSRHTFRTEEYAEYKGNRTAAPAEFKDQIPLIEDVLDAVNIPYFKKEGFEADDIIGTLSTQAVAEGFEVLICSGDRDALQLVNDHVTVLYPKRGVSDLDRMTPIAVEEKHGVGPQRYPDIAALVGETSDNLPGVPGVGPKTAAKWIRQYGGLEELLSHVDEVRGKVGDSLRAHVEDVLRNRRLNALVCDLDLAVHPDELERRMWNREAVHELFDALEFRVLRDRLFALDPTDEPETAAAVDVEGQILEAGTVAGWIDQHLSAEPAGVQLKYTWGRGVGTVDGLAIAVSGGAAAYVSAADITPQDDAAIAAWLADDTKPKVLHDAKGQLLALWSHGWDLQGLVSDTALAAYLIRPDQRAYELEDLSIRYLQREIAADADQNMLFDEHEADGVMVRAQAVLQLSVALTRELDKVDGGDLLSDMELPLTRILARMEQYGIAIDEDHLIDLEREFADRGQAATKEAFAVIGREVNLGSPKQLQVVLFDELNMPKTKRTKTGYTTDAEALQGLFAQTGHPFLEHLLAYRDVTKLRQTVEGLRKTLSDDGRIHTTFQQTIAATGRLSSKDPNLQNIPIRTESGRRIREAFCVGEGFDTLLTADYSQIEMRIMAHMSEDADLINAFKSGEDFHTVMAAKVFDRSPDAIDGELRARIKAMNYGLAYGLSSYGLSQQLGITPGEAQSLMDDYFLRFGGVRDYLQEIVERARATGYTTTMLGRRRYLPDLNSDNRQRRAMAERMALNAPIQGSAADIIKVAMIKVDRALSAGGYRSRMLLQVHDELVLEVVQDEFDAVQQLLRAEMGNAAELSVPLDVSVGVGANWFEAGH